MKYSHYNCSPSALWGRGRESFTRLGSRGKIKNNTKLIPCIASLILSKTSVVMLNWFSVCVYRWLSRTILTCSTSAASYRCTFCLLRTAKWTSEFSWRRGKTFLCKTKCSTSSATCSTMQVCLTLHSFVSLGYWHQRADEMHGNPPPR